MFFKIACLLMLLCLLITTPAEAATNWNWVQTGGGCYTADVVFSEVQQGLAYARCDVGEDRDAVQNRREYAGPEWSALSHSRWPGLFS